MLVIWSYHDSCAVPASAVLVGRQTEVSTRGSSGSELRLTVHPLPQPLEQLAVLEAQLPVAAADRSTAPRHRRPQRRLPRRVARDVGVEPGQVLCTRQWRDQL
jgi:hypothetical protein